MQLGCNYHIRLEQYVHTTWGCYTCDKWEWLMIFLAEIPPDDSIADCIYQGPITAHHGLGLLPQSTSDHNLGMNQNIIHQNTS